MYSKSCYVHKKKQEAKGICGFNDELVMIVWNNHMISKISAHTNQFFIVGQ